MLFRGYIFNHCGVTHSKQLERLRFNHLQGVGGVWLRATTGAGCDPEKFFYSKFTNPCFFQNRVLPTLMGHPIKKI